MTVETMNSVDVEMGLVPLEESESETQSEPEDPVDEAALIQCRAKLKKVDIADASNGATYKVQLEADAPFAEGFVELMGESIYEFLFDGYLFGIGQIKAVNTAADSDNYPHTVLNLLFPSSEIGRSGPMNVLVGQTRPLKVFGIQMAFDLTAKAE